MIQLGENRLRLVPRHHRPCFLSGETQNRCHHAHERLGDVPQRSLRRATGFGVRCVGVQAVFENVQIEATQIL